MKDTGLTKPTRRPSNSTMRRWMIVALGGATGLVGGCVNVTAPDKPIVINLNINVTQQVVYRLDGEAKQLIEKNPDIF